MAQRFLTINTSGDYAELVPSTTGPTTAGNVLGANGSGLVDPTLMPGGSPISTGPGSAGVLVKTNGSGLIDTTLLPGAVGGLTVSAVCSGTISAGMLVNLFNNAGVLTCKAADQSTPARCHGYAPIGGASASTITIDLGQNIISGLSGLTLGADYFLGTVGAVTTTVPTTAAYILQYVGFAISTTSLMFTPLRPTVLA